MVVVQIMIMIMGGGGDLWIPKALKKNDDDDDVDFMGFTHFKLTIITI